MYDDSQALVSVIVPIYNAKKYLVQCLDSIASQTYQNLEIICINDGSTDGSDQIIESYAARDSRFCTINKENGGYGQGCNRGIELAHGEWISIIEPDDWIDSTMYEEMVYFTNSFGQRIDIVKTPWIDVCNWNDPAAQVSRHSPLKGRLRTSTSPFVLTEHPVLIELHPSIWSAIYRKAFLDDRGIRFVEYPGAGWADNPFLIETMCQAKAIAYLDKPFYNYRSDLPGATLHHSTDEAVTRPFDRWLDMLEVINRLGITDERILMAHYLRGFNYVYGAIHDDGWETELVQERTHEVFSKMKSDLVLRMPNLAPHRKKLFFEVVGLPVPKLNKLYWIGHLARETVYTLRSEGLAPVIRKARRALLSDERSKI